MTATGLEIQATIECEFTLKRVHDMIRTYSQYVSFVWVKYLWTGNSEVNTLYNF